jgi:glycosyltransferase involved in cell wall biosynthesis
VPTDSHPFLSVVVPTYNEPVRVQATLGSLARQQLPVEDVEIVVVDDGSLPAVKPEKLADAAKPFALRLRRHETNQGRAKARNSGIRAARGEVVVFLDGDMTVEPGFLNAHKAFHQTHDANCACIGNIRFSSSVKPNALFRYIQGRGVHRFEAGRLVPYNCFVTGNSSIARQALMDCGLFDEDLHAYGGEDLELGYRLARSGTLFYYEATAVSNHHELRSLAELCDLMSVYGAQSMPHMVEKHPELASLLRLRFLIASTPVRWAHRLALSPLVHSPVALLLRCLPRGPVPSILFDYLMWYHRTRAYVCAVDGERQSDRSC